MVDASYIDVNQVVDTNQFMNSTQMQNAANTIADSLKSDAWANLFGYLLSLPAKTLSLIQLNVMWLVPIFGLTFILHWFLIQRFFSTPVSLVVAFLIVMATAFFWIPFLSGAIR